MKLLDKFTLLIILIFISVINIPLLNGNTPIAWDTFHPGYELFSIMYNSVNFNNQLPLWLPFSDYGIPNFFWLPSLTSVNFLFIGIGKLFHIQNTLLLYNASLFGEQLISVFGMYLLANLIYRKRITVIITCLSFAATFFLYRQVYLNFHIIYLFPLMLFWIVQFFQQKKAVYLWLAGITILISIPGSGFYPLTIVFYSIAIFSLIFFFFDITSIKAIFKWSRSTYVAFGILILTALVFAFYFSTFSKGVGIIRDGRNANFVVPINVFLSNFRKFDPLVLLGSYLYGVIPYNFSNAYEYTFYIGLPAIVGVIAACLYQRKTIWWAIMSASLFLFAFSLGGFFSFAAYFLPYIDITRYISVLGSIPFRTLLIIIGGLGIDQDLSITQWRKVGFTFLGLYFFLDVIGLITSPLNPDSETGYVEMFMNPTLYTTDFKYFVIRIGGYFLLFLLIFFLDKWNKSLSSERFHLVPIANIGLLLFLVVDLGLFRINYENKIQVYLHRQKEQVQYLPLARPLIYQSQRSIDPVDDEEIQAYNATTVFQSFDGYSNGYDMESYLQFDHCIPDSVGRSKKYEVFNPSLAPLIQNKIIPTSMEESSSGIKQILGCEFPKLRVVTNVNVTTSDQEAIKEISETNDFSNLVILSGERTQFKSSLNNPQATADIEVIEFSANHIKIKVDIQQDDGFLVYSDGYHTQWVARVNGVIKPIEQAYLAFKAIPLSKGTNVVELDYGSPLSHIGYMTLVVICGMAALALFIWIIIVIFSSQDKYIKPN
jgi:hypothetical protein